jgi:hypothetical protein
MTLLKHNAEIIEIFTQQGWMGGTASGFVTDTNFFTGHFPLNDVPSTLDGDDGDMFKATVSDDLTTVGRLHMSISYWRVVV